MTKRAASPKINSLQDIFPLMDQMEPCDTRPQSIEDRCTLVLSAIEAQIGRVKKCNHPLLYKALELTLGLGRKLKTEAAREKKRGIERPSNRLMEAYGILLSSLLQAVALQQADLLKTS